MRQRLVSILIKCTGCKAVLVDETIESESYEDEPRHIGPWVEVCGKDYSLCGECFHVFYASIDKALVYIGVDEDASGTLSISFQPATGAMVA